jgi:hypothetical protein
LEISEVLKKLEQFKEGGTNQEWVMDPPPLSITFENDYIEILRIDSSNKAGGSGVKNGKQWGIIIEMKKDFRILPNWKKLKEGLGNDIGVTPVTKGQNSGKHGIRLYKMSKNMDRKIVEELLEFIFE